MKKLWQPYTYVPACLIRRLLRATATSHQVRIHTCVSASFAGSCGSNVGASWAVAMDRRARGAKAKQATSTPRMRGGAGWRGGVAALLQVDG
jgi:hypothetical protein